MRSTEYEDFIYGVCQGLGEDLGVPPDIFRVAVAVAMLFSPAWAVGAYLVGGLIVMATRFIHRKPMPRAKSAAQPLLAGNDDIAAETRLAA